MHNSQVRVTALENSYILPSSLRKLLFSKPLASTLLKGTTTPVHWAMPHLVYCNCAGREVVIGVCRENRKEKLLAVCFPVTWCPCRALCYLPQHSHNGFSLNLKYPQYNSRRTATHESKTELQAAPWKSQGNIQVPERGLQCLLSTTHGTQVLLILRSSDQSCSAGLSGLPSLSSHQWLTVLNRWGEKKELWTKRDFLWLVLGKLKALLGKTVC